MTSARDKYGRPTVVVTGMGVITSLGAGKSQNWAKLMEGRSGIRRISRFPTEGLKTTIAGAVDRATFTHIDSDISFPLPQPLADIDSYVVYVGFDPSALQPEKPKVPAKKAKPKRVTTQKQS